MTSKQLKTCFRKIKQEKDDRNLLEIYVDTKICAIRCNDIQLYSSGSILFEDLLMLVDENKNTISIIDIKDITNIRFTDTNHETFKLI